MIKAQLEWNGRRLSVGAAVGTVEITIAELSSVLDEVVTSVRDEALAGVNREQYHALQDARTEAAARARAEALVHLENEKTIALATARAKIEDMLRDEVGHLGPAFDRIIVKLRGIL